MHISVDIKTLLSGFPVHQLKEEIFSQTFTYYSKTQNYRVVILFAICTAQFSTMPVHNKKTLHASQKKFQ